MVELLNVPLAQPDNIAIALRTHRTVVLDTTLCLVKIVVPNAHKASIVIQLHQLQSYVHQAPIVAMDIQLARLIVPLVPIVQALEVAQVSKLAQLASIPKLNLQYVWTVHQGITAQEAQTNRPKRRTCLCCFAQQPCNRRSY